MKGLLFSRDTMRPFVCMAWKLFGLALSIAEVAESVQTELIDGGGVWTRLYSSILMVLDLWATSFMLNWWTLYLIKLLQNWWTLPCLMMAKWINLTLLNHFQNWWFPFSMNSVGKFYKISKNFYAKIYSHKLFDKISKFRWRNSVNLEYLRNFFFSTE